MKPGPVPTHPQLPFPPLSLPFHLLAPGELQNPLGILIDLRLEQARLGLLLLQLLLLDLGLLLPLPDVDILILSFDLLIFVGLVDLWFESVGIELGFLFLPGARACVAPSAAFSSGWRAWSSR